MYNASAMRPRDSQINSIIAYLDNWAMIQPEQRYATFINVHGNETESYTYQSFDERTRYVAEYLAQQVGLQRGERVLLVYPPGLEVIVAFFACARLGAISVPVYPPMQTPERGMAKLAFIVEDCDARVALTTHNFKGTYEAFSNARNIDRVSALVHLEWIATDDLRGRASETFHNNAHPILFLQYTSGSTSDPKGVIVSHDNVIHNCRAITDHKPIGVSWLPQYHDMGLIGYYLFPLIAGGTIYGFSPTDFLRRPILWLQTLSRVRATCSSAPNFGFDYCLREDKVPSDQLADLDLSSLRVLMNASEPTRPDTYNDFFKRFAPCGLRPEAHVVAYGLAENTLAVTNHGKRNIAVNKHLLQRRTLQLETNIGEQLHIASCGKPLDGIRVRIVDPQSRELLKEGKLGEVWVGGKSTCQGYWNRPELSREVFGNRITNGPHDRNRYLRTGDLGFLDDGELFICGRIKDLIIIRGVNYYPQDIESIVESASSKIRRGGVAAFEANAHGLVVMAEVKKTKDLPDPDKIIQAVFAYCNVRPDALVFVSPRTIMKTTSGKMARGPTREQWLAGKLRVIATHVTLPAEIDEAQPAGPRRGLSHFLQRYNLSGNEQCTLAELGLDSLGMVSLLDDIELTIKQHGFDDLLGEIDGRLIQQLTVVELFSLFDQLEAASDADRITRLQSVLKKLRQERDDLQRDRMRCDARLDSLNFVETEEALTNVLLTGPTGFFGPFLLNSLLRHTAYNYFLLTRASDIAHGMDRIRDSLRRAQLWTPTIEEQLKHRVHIVCGDISQHNLGLQTQQWQSLTRNVQAVIHNAALVNYVLNYDALRRHNVEGTRELLRFSATGTKKEFHLISSTVIFGWSVKRELLESDNNDEMQNLDFGYSQTKWVAEQLVFAAERQGLKARIYRPSFITASAAAVASKDDIVIRLLAFMIEQGIAVKAENQISFLPAEVVADNIVAIFKRRSTKARMFHITADSYYNMMDITRLITRDYGYEFVYYDIPAFVAEMKRRCTPDNLLYPLLDFFNRSQQKLAAMQQKRYNNDNYREARRSAAVGPNEPTLEEVVSYLMAYMRREGLIGGSRGTEIDQIEARVDHCEESHVQQGSTPRIGRLDASVRSIRS